MRKSLKLSYVLLLGLILVIVPAAASETVNDITRLNPIIVDHVVTPTSTQEISNLVAHQAGPISIGGGRYSQGGQTATENCLFLDMRAMNKIIKIDKDQKRITVEAGATWRQIQEALDPEGLAIKIMQSYSNFTVGGSLSVNVHGRYVGQGPIIRSVRSIKLVLADGSIKKASPTENSKLFYSAIGGYGGIGVITEATLDLTDNTPIERFSKVMEWTKYKDYFFNNIRNSKTAIFHHADLYPPNYTNVNAITYQLTDQPLTIKEKLAPQDKLTFFQRFLLMWESDGFLGKTIRQYVYDPLVFSQHVVEWRNYEASQDVVSLEPFSREKSTYVLQEYFIPVGKFEEFIPKLAAILKSNDVNVLNISIRNALPDPGSLLAWARSEVFSFVLYYKQDVTEKEKEHVHIWTNQLIEAALSEGGSYYLPYQIIATPEQFRRAYPRSAEYFSIKKQFDPTCKFRNKLWDRYYHPTS